MENSNTPSHFSCWQSLHKYHEITDCKTKSLDPVGCRSKLRGGGGVNKLKETEDFSHFAVNCLNVREELESLWSHLKNKVISSNPLNGSAIAGFISYLAPQERLQLLLGGLAVAV